MEVRMGSIVRSIAGRDKGGLFIVMSVEDGYVTLADGDTRKADRPKRKKLKHIQVSGKICEVIAQKLNNTQTIADYELRKALAEMVLR